MQEAIVLFPGEGRTVTVTNTCTTFKVTSEVNGGRFSLAEYDLPAGFPGPPPHVHKKFEHAWYVLGGELQVQINQRIIQAPAGTFVFVPKGTTHTFSNPGSVNVRMLAIDTPGGLEPYYEELANAFPDGTPLNPQVIRNIQERYDTFPPAG